jgi:DEAD/DEAH box helicase/Helicase conserved C-terminal domain
MNRAGIDKVLDLIEDKEEVSLHWGDVDGSLSEEEVIELAAEAVPGEDPEALVEALLDRALLHESHTTGSPRYRSRFAETMRLFARLRQTFPNQSWRGAPPLVADFRVDRRPRRYPRRDRDALGLLASQEAFTPVQRAVFEALVEPLGSPPLIARFQEEATLRLMQQSADQGVIITAGTGSGKTLAFYLPALMRIAEMAWPNDFWVKALAIYPRNELLKDQITEAYRMVCRARSALQGSGRRSIRIGALYGGAPNEAKTVALEYAGWKLGRDRWICPFLRCPECDGELAWTKADLAARNERLTCVKGCVSPYMADAVALTRERILAEPPDVLFTTTEMLNQRLSDTKRRGVFGIGQPKGRRPDLVLLDEAHTYSGAAGAQAALTLRRWRGLLNQPVFWVGLSATLLEAPRFFADLAGLAPSRVVEITPAAEDMVPEGREYQIVLRGDPAARASLLSTSIQTAMLLGRVLDPPAAPSEGRFGRRLFAFTDDLDVTNRLHDDLSNAEGYDRFGKEDPARRPLAALRAEEPSESLRAARARDADGQRWILAERVGRNLRTPLVIGRTTSRDPGVDGRADVIVATAALEVGFNDPLVGAVLQHKAPRSFAAFVQRRGRAGRNPRMRPITVTVLSDYGRDRHLFQSYELLFEPTLAPQSLPIRNQYILRMQAAYALLDWLADQERPPGVWNGWLWRDGAEPADEVGNTSFRRHLRAILSDVVQDRNGRLDHLRSHLGQALRLDPEAVERLLWEPPRSLLLEVAPTLLRRLHRNFKLAWPRGGRTHDRYIERHPFPEFVPRALFADLNLPEVEIVLPPATVRDTETRESVPILEALTQLPPGRVNRRFGDAYGGLSHWIPVPPGVAEYDLPIEQYAETSEYVGRLAGNSAAGRVELPVFRPWRVRVEKAQRSDVLPSSNARLTWASGFVPHGDPVDIASPSGTVWRALVRGVWLFLHQFRASVGVRRFATGALADVKRLPDVNQVVEVRFTRDGEPAAVGFEFETDGMALDVALPAAAALADRRLDPALERSVRSAFHRRLVADDREMAVDVNGFERSWLRQVHFCAAARKALDTGCSLAEAAAQLAISSDPAPFENVLEALLGTQTLAEAEAVGQQDEDGSAEELEARGRPRGTRLERLKTGLRERLSDPAIRHRLAANAAEAFGWAGLGRAKFLRRTLEETLADAAIAAVMQAAPRQAAADALVADVETSDDAPDQATIWITETTLGGAGVLQATAEIIAREPRLLFRSIEAVLEPSDLEVAAAALSRTVRLAMTDGAVAASMAQLRAEPSHDDRARLRRRLLDQLERAGIEVSRAFAVSLSVRLLAPGTSGATDTLLARLLQFWDQAEARLAVSLEPREVAVLAAGESEVQRLAGAAGLFDAGTSDSERVTVLSSLLWPRADGLRREALAAWNPFCQNREGDPLVVRALLLDVDGSAISLLDKSWREQIDERLVEAGTARIAAPVDQRDLLRGAVVEMQARPVEFGYLKLYPVLERVVRTDLELVAGFVLRERV